VPTISFGVLWTPANNRLAVFVCDEVGVQAIRVLISLLLLAFEVGQIDGWTDKQAAGGRIERERERERERGYYIQVVGCIRAVCGATWLHHLLHVTLKYLLTVHLLYEC
jgi:hypothetical protein